MIVAAIGDVLECARSHMVFTLGGDIAYLDEGELLIVIESESFMGPALRVETGEFVTLMLLDMFGYPASYTQVGV